MYGKLLSQLVKAMINCLLTRLACTLPVPRFTSCCKLRLCERPQACKSPGMTLSVGK